MPWLLVTQSMDVDEGPDQHLTPLALLDMTAWAFINGISSHAISTKIM